MSWFSEVFHLQLLSPIEGLKAPPPRLANKEVIIEDHVRDIPDSLSIIRDFNNIANQGLHDGDTVNDFCDVMTRIEDAIIATTTYQGSMHYIPNLLVDD